MEAAPEDRTTDKDEADTQPPGSARARLARWLHCAGAKCLTSGGFESQRYLTKWVLLGTAIGIVAGLGAVVFYIGIDWATHFFLGTLVGYRPPAPVGEGSPTIVRDGPPLAAARRHRAGRR